MLLRDERVERVEALVAGGVEQVAAVDVQQVEEVGGDRDAGVLGGAAGGVLEGHRAPVVGEGERLAVEDEALGRQRAGDLDHLGEPRGDVVEAAGHDEHLVAVAVHLDADAVELGVDGDLGLAVGREAPHRGSDVGRAGGEHRHASVGRPRARSRPAPPRPRTPPRRPPPCEPASIAARRTAASGTSATWATASCVTASSAPWRTLPVTIATQPRLLVGGRAAEQLRRPPPSARPATRRRTGATSPRRPRGPRRP